MKIVLLIIPDGWLFTIKIKKQSYCCSHHGVVGKVNVVMDPACILLLPATPNLQVVVLGYTLGAVPLLLHTRAIFLRITAPGS